MITKEDEALATDKRLIGFSALSNFIDTCSSPRAVMFSSFISSFIPLEHGEPKIILSGVEEEFVKTLFHKKMKNDSKILAIVDRYDGKTNDRISTSTEKFIIYLDLELDEINYINIPIMEKYSPKFGFTHRETGVLNEIEYGDVIEKDTLLTRTNSQNDDGDLCVGLNVNMCLASLKEIGEDAIVISESLSERGSFKTYETIKLQFGLKDIPLNLYGDDTEYKIIPDIGENVHDSGILFASRHVYEHTDNSLLPAIMSARHLQSYRPIFDKCVYVKNNRGKVIDVKVLHTPKTKSSSTYTKVDAQMKKYVKSLEDFNTSFINTVESIQEMYGNDVKVGDKLHRYMVDLYSVRDPKLTNIMNQEPLDLYMVEIVVEFKHKLKVGNKLSGYYGDFQI